MNTSRVCDLRKENDRIRGNCRGQPRRKRIRLDGVNDGVGGMRSDMIECIPDCDFGCVGKERKGRVMMR